MMDWIRITSSFLLMLGVASCAAITKDPWDWLNDSKAQKWREVEIDGVGREISFSVPDSMRGDGKRTEYWPKDIAPQDTFHVKLPIEKGQGHAVIIASFTWDTWWGGFYKKGGEDFYFVVKSFRVASSKNLLDLALEERIEWVIDYRLSKFLKPVSGKNPNQQFFEENFWVKPFESDSGLWWVRHNDPMVSEDHERFITPVSDHHILDFTFFVNKLRYDTKEDPEWNQSRWELVEKIMKTVRITPDPFGNQPEEIPPH